MTRDKINHQISAEKTAEKIQTLLADLTKCMTQETLAIQSNNQEIAGKMSQEKMRLLPNYQAIAKDLERNPDLLNQLDDEVRANLKNILADFDSIMKENLTTIHAGKNAISRVINRLLKKAREAASARTQSYNEKGQMIEKSYGGGLMTKTIKGQLSEQY